MYFLDENVEKCGFYECKKCGYRFLSEIIKNKASCPLCEQDIDYEIGPDESIENYPETALLIDVIEGKEDVERMDILLSCAFVDDESWI